MDTTLGSGCGGNGPRGGILGAQAPATYTFGGVSCAAAPSNFDAYRFGGVGFNPFEAAVLNTGNFGASGTVPVTLTTTALTSFSAADLNGVNGIVIPWWLISAPARMRHSCRIFFLSGGDLFILADDPNHDPVMPRLL